MRRDLQMKEPPVFDAVTIMENLQVWGVNTLAEILARCGDQYWSEKELTLVDGEFDKVVEQLRRKYPTHCQLDALGGEPEGRVY